MTKKIKNKPYSGANFILVLFASLGATSAQVMPSPADIYTSATNFWYGDNLPGFSTYTTNLYSGVATNYVAPTLLSAFYDYVFLGELVSASNKYAQVQSKVVKSPEVFTNPFRGMLLMALESVTDDIKRYNDANKPLNEAKALASPQEIRDDSMGMPIVFPHLFIIKGAPEIQIK